MAQRVASSLPYSGIISIDRLNEDPFRSVICYPHFSEREMYERLRGMRSLRIEAIEFRGNTIINNVSVLGKGCVGVVVLAHTPSTKGALKIRRTDADRDSMKREAEMLKIANSVGVGPKLYGYTKNLLLTEYIDGITLPEWLKKIGKNRPKTKEKVKGVLREVLRQSRMLDLVGLDHGELSRASRHIIVKRDGKICIVDFETASTKRKVSNLTSVCQFLFISGKVSKEVSKYIGDVDRDKLISALRDYKKSMSSYAFLKILKVTGEA